MKLDLASAIQDYVYSHVVNNVLTACPARVVGVINDLFGLQVNAQPLITYKGGVDNTDVIEQPVIYGVSVQMPSSSTSAMTFPVNVGDPVLLVFSHDNIDTFMQGSGSFSAPSDDRVWSYMDCVAIPGWWPIGNSINNPAKRRLPHNTSDMVVAHNIGTPNECEIRLKPSGDIDITSPATVNVKSAAANVTTTGNASVSANGVSVTASGTANISVTGAATVTAATLALNGIDWSTHTHLVTTLGAQSGPPV